MTQVGDIWFRLKDQGYSIPDEWGNHAYTRYEVEVHKYKVVKITPCGVKVCRIVGSWVSSKEQFIRATATKRFACPTMEEAKVSFIARKDKQAKIHESKAITAREMIARVELFKLL